MKRFLAILLLCATASAQNLTVVSDTNRVIRTNFTLVRSQVTDLDGATFAISNITGLQSALDGKLATNGSAAALTNFPGDIIATNVSGVVAVTNGGTGASDVTNARVNLLPAYTNNENKVLTLNTNGTDVIWAEGGATPNVSNAIGVLAVANGGTGATNAQTALTNLTILGSNARILIGQSATNSGVSNVVIGPLAKVLTGLADRGVVIGHNASSDSDDAVAIGASAGAGSGSSVALGKSASVGFPSSSAIAIGDSATVASGYSDAIAVGRSARAAGTSAIQIGNGTNSTADTIQFLTAGSVDTNEWARIAELSTYPTTNISVVGTNNTNTLVFSNGILVEVQ